MITLPKATSKTPRGAFGKYFKISPTRGVKVLRESFGSIEAAYNSWAFDQAKEEAEILKVAEGSGVTPKCYGVRVVRRGKRYRVGILMQHLGDKTLGDLNYSKNKESDIYDMLNDALQHAGVEHNDLHKYNIMFHKGKFYAIDFSPGCSYVSDSN